jgi:hypothetical protein
MAERSRTSLELHVVGIDATLGNRQRPLGHLDWGLPSLGEAICSVHSRRQRTSQRAHIPA